MVVGIVEVTVGVTLEVVAPLAIVQVSDGGFPINADAFPSF